MSAWKIESRRPAARPYECATGGDSGFTLVETLAALAIFALAFSGLYRALEGGWQALRRAQLEADAIEVAKAQLATVGTVIPLAEGRRSGTSSDGLLWQTDIRQRSPENPPNATRPRPPVYDVTVTARRSEASGTLSSVVSLKTIMLGERLP